MAVVVVVVVTASGGGCSSSSSSSSRSSAVRCGAVRVRLTGLVDGQVKTEGVVVVVASQVLCGREW